MSPVRISKVPRLVVNLGKIALDEPGLVVLVGMLTLLPGPISAKPPLGEPEIDAKICQQQNHDFEEGEMEGLSDKEYDYDSTEEGEDCPLASLGDLSQGQWFRGFLGIWLLASARV